jgi:hypothetical protein
MKTIRPFGLLERYDGVFMAEGVATRDLSRAMKAATRTT